MKEKSRASFQQELFALRDAEYAVFSAKLIPNIPPQSVIGVRLPVLRQFAKTCFGSAQAEAFLRQLPHDYLEENHLHSFLIAGIKEFDTCLAEVNRFLPFVDNWATCDSLRPKCFAKNKTALLPHIERWLQSEQVYTVRFGIGMLMCHYLDGDFQPHYIDMVAQVKSEEYYVNMMRAWYIATALAKQYESTVGLLERASMDSFTHNKAIQKACESFRVSAEHKAYLKTLKMHPSKPS